VGGSFALRALSLDDAEAVVGLIAARNRADFGETDYFDFAAEDLRELWCLDEPRLATDAWVAVAGPEVVGYANLDAERDLASLADESCVHPAHRGHGMGTALLDRAEARGREAGLARFQVHVVNDDGRLLVERRGHRLVRYFWRMEIRLDRVPAEPQLPNGYAVRSYRPGADDAALHALIQEAFAAHWEFTPEPLEDWLRGRTSRGDYHPALWQVGEADGEPAGAALCFGDRELGWVLELGV
jgi:mycothiol synthase